VVAASIGGSGILRFAQLNNGSVEIGMSKWLQGSLGGAVLLVAAALGHAQSTDPLPVETQLVTAPAAPAATEQTFSIATAEDLVVTLTDLQTPAALTGATMVVTQGGSIVASTSLAPPATSATLNLTGAVGQYTLRVFGTPSSTFNVGTFGACTAPAASPTACIADASIAGSISLQSTTANPTQTTLYQTLTVTVGGNYTFTYGDDQFPAALSTPPSLALFQGSTVIAVPLPASPATIPLTPGVYTLFGFAQAASSTQAGLFGITISGPAGLAPLLDSTFPVGTLSAPTPATNPSAQQLTLRVTDFSFPAALANAGALVTAGGTALPGGSATVAPGAANFAAPAGTLQMWSYGSGAGGGAFEASLSSTAGILAQSDMGVNGTGVMVYAFTTSPLTAGTSYQVSATDYQFPAQLQGLQFAVAQSGAIQSPAPSVGPPLTFTAAAAPAVLLVAATPPTNGNGMFDINLQTSGASPQFVFDQTQGVSATGLFTSQTVHIATAGNYDVTLADLGFPAPFASLAVLASRDGANLGKIFGGGTFTIAATPGDYQLNFIATPGTFASGTNSGMAANYGIYSVQVVNSPLSVTLTASPTTVIAGGTSTLSWTTTNATACTGSGGSFTGNQTIGTGSATVTVAATTTYTLSCTGADGSTGQATATVTATALTTSTSGRGGGGEIDVAVLGLLGLLSARRVRERLARHRA
jgi:hypothetical protein